MFKRLTSKVYSFFLVGEHCPSSRSYLHENAEGNENNHGDSVMMGVLFRVHTAKAP